MQPAFHSAVRFSIESSDGVTAVSDWLRRQTLEAFEITSAIEVIPNFVDTERFAPRPAFDCRCSFSSTGRKIVMHASNFRPVKNVPSVIRTFERIQREVPANLILVGEGPELPHAHDLVRSLGLEDRVFFLGIQEAIDELLVQTDLLLQPSRHESFGLTALEAMATGVPVVLTDQGGTLEVIESGVSGLLADPEDVTGMAEWSVRLLTDREQWEAVSRAARSRAVERFEQGRIVERYLAYYQKVLGQETRAPAR